MNYLKIALILASSILLAFFSLLLVAQNPEQAMFDKTIEKLMNESNLSSPEEVIDALPELKIVKLKMDSARYLSAMINCKIQGPNTAISERESLDIQTQIGVIRQLRKESREELERLVIAHHTRALQSIIPPVNH